MAGHYDIHIDNGSDYNSRLELNNDDGTTVDLTGYTIAMNLEGCLVVPTLAITLPNIIDITILGSVTSKAIQRTAKYTINLVSATSTSRLMEGKVFFNKGVNCAG